MTIITDARGNKLLEFTPTNEENIYEIAHDAPLTHSLVVVRHHDRYLMAYSTQRREWEIFGGRMDEEDSPRTAVVNALQKSVGIEYWEPQFLGVMKLQLKPEDRIEYGALFGVPLDILQPIQLYDDDVVGVILWDKQTEIGQMNVIDVQYLEYFAP